VSAVDAIETLLTRKRLSGMFHLNTAISADILRQRAEELGLRFFHIDGSRIISKQSLFDAISHEMAFPDYFGGNWDALFECIRDLGWIDAPGYVLLYADYQMLAQSDATSFRITFEIFADTVKHWDEIARNDPPMYILLRGERSLLPGIEVLSSITRL
jgi:RNAse (barnase) inhibitor barstar